MIHVNLQEKFCRSLDNTVDIVYPRTDTTTNASAAAAHVKFVYGCTLSSYDYVTQWIASK